MSELENIFGNSNQGFRFLNKDINENERNNYKGWWLEQIYQYGTIIDYYSNGTTLEQADSLYGEQPAQQFLDPQKMIFAISLNENSVVLQKFGLVSDDELTGFIPIESYTRCMSSANVPNPEPKAGDVIELTEFGSTRPGRRGAKKFEITDRLDQDVEQVNPLLGHYVWLIKAKRFDYSYEQGITAEPGLEQPTDDTYHGGLSGDIQLEDDQYHFNDVDRASRNIFDYSVYGDYDDIYGGYDDD